MGFEELYVADLDAIIDCSDNFEVFRQIAEATGLGLMVDAGITNLERAEKLLESGVSKLVIGTETLQSKSFVAEAVRRFGSEHVIISLDLKGNDVLVGKGFDDCIEPICLLKEFKEMGVREVIVLDLTRVGSGEGVNTDFLKEAMQVGLEVYVGGGVRNLEDLLELKQLGVSAVLVASALHYGKLSIRELKEKELI